MEVKLEYAAFVTSGSMFGTLCSHLCNSIISNVLDTEL